MTRIADMSLIHDPILNLHASVLAPISDLHTAVLAAALAADWSQASTVLLAAAAAILLMVGLPRRSTVSNSGASMAAIEHGALEHPLLLALILGSLVRSLQPARLTKDRHTSQLMAEQPV